MTTELSSPTAGPNTAASLSRADLEIGEEIGRGAFSRVYRGKFRGADCAIKKLVVAQHDLDRHLLSELSLLNSAVMLHPNLIKYFGVAIEPVASPGPNMQASREVLIVTEFMDGGDLRSVLQSTDSALPWALRVRIARDIASALSQLHAAEVVHRDIKTENILLDNSWRCVLADYGFARKARMGVATAMTMCGTNEFMAPEILWGEAYDERADVFSLGVVCWELLTRRMPGKLGFMVREARTKFKLDFAAMRALVPPGAPESLVNCAVACCAYEPEGRPASEDIVEWLSDLLRELDASDTYGIGTKAVPTPASIVAERKAATAAAAAAAASAASASPADSMRRSAESGPGTGAGAILTSPTSTSGSAAFGGTPTSSQSGLPAVSGLSVGGISSGSSY